MILDNFYELLETINVLLFKKKLIEGKNRDKRRKAKQKLKKAKKSEKDARQSRNKKRKKQEKAQDKVDNNQNNIDKRCGNPNTYKLKRHKGTGKTELYDKDGNRVTGKNRNNNNMEKCKDSMQNYRRNNKKLEKRNEKLTKAQNKLDKREKTTDNKEKKVEKIKAEIQEKKDKKRDREISETDPIIASSIRNNENKISDLESKLDEVEDTADNLDDSFYDLQSQTETKLSNNVSEATQAGREAGRDAGDSAGEYAGSIGANDFIKDRFGKELDEMADDFVRKSATDAGVKATKDYLSSGLYIKCSPVQDSSVDNKRSNVLLYDDSNIDSKISKNTDVPDYSTIILIISGMGILIYIISKIYPSMKRVNILPSSLRTVRWLTSIYLLVFGVMCIYIVDSLNILADYAKQVINIIKKDIKNDRTGKKVDDVDVKEIKQIINKSGLTTILNGLGFNDSDINKYANSINNLIKGNDVSFEIEKRYGFFENETYEKMSLGAFFAYYVLIMCYMYLIYLNWKNISKSALSFLTILILTYWGIFAVIGMLIYYVWFNVYNKDSINGSANKWKGITSNNDLEKKYVNRLIKGTLCISAVVFDPFLKRLIKSYIKKSNNNEGEFNNNEGEFNNNEGEFNNNEG